ncbi:chromatin assembly factor 1 subunit A-domain-containing protein [Elsinoe ampelina]|uniref:Chromatin assembly factor 1 subunit A-domain-containing protein n=1 Tax=Elsinoe ampelina TaxID=302913 RepID=A0A6A6G5F5_9PEZI|nr:chromatin assembly factor 1 subunit A-domain-containing protein [Elsinoe ampelina]
MDIDTVVNPLKRTIDDFHGKSHQTSGAATSEHSMPTPPHSSSESGNTHDVSPSRLQRDPSPALSTSTLSSLPTSTAGSNAAAQPVAGLDGSGDRPAKRRKLTPAEKLQQAQEKAERQRLREEKRAQKEAEAAVKAEERRHKNEEKEMKQREKDLIKQQKEEEKRKKEEEEAKKQRAQSRLGNFFTTTTPAKTVKTEGIVRRTSIDGGLSSKGSEDRKPALPPHSHSVTETSKKGPQTYETYFLSFIPSQHSTLAQTSLPVPDAEEAQVRFDSEMIRSRDGQIPPAVTSFFDRTQERLRLPASACKIFELMEGTSSRPVDLTCEHSNQLDLSTARVDVKHIQFSEDVRPPYSGSYTRIADKRRARAFARAPLRRARPDTNYDYDSEAEWEEPEEGDDLLSDEEDDMDSEGVPEEMDEFLDDGDDPQIGRAKLNSYGEVLNSGICWEDRSATKPHAADGHFDLSTMCLEFILPDASIRSIDPFSDQYWVAKGTTATSSRSATTTATPDAPRFDLFGNPVPSTSNMKPPRAPLQPFTNGSNHQSVMTSASGTGPLMKAAKVPAAKLNGTDFEHLKEAVIGSDMSKGDLLKALKQRFPKFTNESIKETVTAGFEKVGPKGQKKWQLMQK